MTPSVTVRRSPWFPSATRALSGLIRPESRSTFVTASKPPSSRALWKTPSVGVSNTASSATEPAGPVCGRGRTTFGFREVPGAVSDEHGLPVARRESETQSENNPGANQETPGAVLNPNLSNHESDTETADDPQLQRCGAERGDTFALILRRVGGEAQRTSAGEAEAGAAGHRNERVAAVLGDRLSETADALAEATKRACDALSLLNKDRSNQRLLLRAVRAARACDRLKNELKTILS